jgi:regulatory protein
MTEARALALAYAHLNRRDRTEAELRGYLTRQGIEPAHVDAAVTELLDLGYLDDARYARLFVEDKRTLAEWGSERIRRGLSQRGVDRELIERALRGDDLAACGGNLPGPDPVGIAGDEHDDELGRALTLLRRRFPEPPVARRERERALGMMLRKGYDSELALDALAAYARE